ncbi:MAG: hopanoid biosynthesis associated radical SAM protein HpnH, partial [Planctomycetes bacterium]|nr:hopanoid biosynthesis associated radical SAM protein HpnH [Planctomycetota bacterium]
MGVPVSQMWSVVKYVLGRKLRRVKRYPLVLMLEPLFRCNLACAGCGKIQYPPEILKKQLTPEECFRAVDECGVPIVSIPGGEPLLHPEIDTIVEGLVARKKYVYLCTNALLLEKNMHSVR